MMQRALLSMLLPRSIYRAGLRHKLTLCDTLRKDQFRILLFADALGPTTQINWCRPLSKYRSQGRCAIWLLEEDRIEGYSAKHGFDNFQANLTELLEEVRPDVIAASRYGGRSTARIISASREADIPIIFHIDDNLLAVPPELGAAKTAKYGAPERLTALRQFLTEADLVYVSTERLLQQLISMDARPRKHFVGHIAGGADPIDSPHSKYPPGSLKIGYMGSSSHGHDLAAIVPVLNRIQNRYPEVKFELFGSIKMPAEFNNNGVVHHPAISNYDEFLVALAELRWDIAIAPLRLTEFNLAKTNTKWIEYTAAGIPVICSRHPVYEEIGAANAALMADTEEEWHEALVMLIENSTLRARLLSSARDVLRSRFSLGHLRSQLVDVLNAARSDRKTAEINLTEM